MTEQSVTLTDVLAAKEKRRQRQDELRSKTGANIISITINMPGPVKDRPVLRALRDYAVQAISSELDVIQELKVNAATGPEALLAVAGDAVRLKALAVKIEEDQPFGRLLDMDVFSSTGELISRCREGRQRPCLVCGRPAVECMRERRHNLDELTARVGNLLALFQADRTRYVSRRAEKIGAAAVEAMLFEAACTPAPGLVDRDNSGAHKDMDFFSFLASSAALAHTMSRLAQAGINHDGHMPDLLPVLRYIGQEGEIAMLRATGGVNTQKGLLFSLGIVAAAAGASSPADDKYDSKTILNITADIVTGIVERELAGSGSKTDNGLTAGERLYRKYGVTGIRGEMEHGLPAVLIHGLPALKDALAKALPINDALVNTLLVLMTCVDDTTVMHRHEPDTMRRWVRERAGEALAAGGMFHACGKAMVQKLDEEFIAHNVSPGGAADLLAVTWFLHRFEKGL